MSDWQPIETAPKDGTPMLATLEVNSLCGVKWWQTDVVFCDDETGEIHNDCDFGWRLDDYSHWQPLPEPPQ